MRGLASALVLLTVTMVVFGNPPSDEDWSFGNVTTGADGDGVEVEASHQTEGDRTTVPANDIDWLPSIDDLWTPPPKPRDLEFERCVVEWDDGRSCFLSPDDDDATEEDAVEIPPVTIHDVARFAPEGPTLAGEPENVGVVGLPTNFVATAVAHTVEGELFGLPVTVRFTPAAYDFSFGDGTIATTTTGGQSWDALDQAQFTPTPTSHTYAERGTYPASVNVRYTAEVDFGIGWFPISGEVTAEGSAQDIRVFEAHTALVAHTCEQAPSAPGC